MTLADPYPETLAEVDEKALGFGPSVEDPQLRVLTRIAVALEQIALNQLDRPQPVQNAPQAALAALPPVRPAAPVGDGCPIHNVPWKVVPAGVSKKSGKPYESFRACSIAGCDQRPR